MYLNIEMASCFLLQMWVPKSLRNDQVAQLISSMESFRPQMEKLYCH
jgi:hypothetical protein